LPTHIALAIKTFKLSSVSHQSSTEIWHFANIITGLIAMQVLATAKEEEVEVDGVPRRVRLLGFARRLGVRLFDFARRKRKSRTPCEVVTK
jgi:hypothetical protein